MSVSTPCILLRKYLLDWKRNTQGI